MLKNLASFLIFLLRIAIRDGIHPKPQRNEVVGIHERTFLTVHSSQILFKVFEGTQFAAVLFYFILICWIIFSVSTALYFITRIKAIR